MFLGNFLTVKQVHYVDRDVGRKLGVVPAQLGDKRNGDGHMAPSWIASKAHSTTCSVASRGRGRDAGRKRLGTCPERLVGRETRSCSPIQVLAGQGRERKKRYAPSVMPMPARRIGTRPMRGAMNSPSKGGDRETGAVVVERGDEREATTGRESLRGHTHLVRFRVAATWSLRRGPWSCIRSRTKARSEQSCFEGNRGQNGPDAAYTLRAIGVESSSSAGFGVFPIEFAVDVRNHGC